MLITDELSNALKKLGNSCLLNVSRTVSDFLKESASDEELCAFIERNSSSVSFSDEFRALAKTKKFPLEPERALPFIYSVLYVFDTNKLQPEDVISRVYPQTDIDEACTLFFTEMEDALVSSLDKAVLDENDSDAESFLFGDSDDALNELIVFAGGLQKANAESIIEKAKDLKSSLSGDSSEIKSRYYALESSVKSENIPLTVLDGIKDLLMEKGVIV